MQEQGFNIRMNGIVGIVFMVLVFVALFFIAKGIFTVLAWLAPALIIGALLIHYRTVLNYLRFIFSLLQRNLFAGILVIILSVIGFPILSGFLFGKAILDRKVKKLHQAHEARQEAEYVEFEEVIRHEEEKKLDLPPMEKRPPAQKDNQYEDLF
jgi:predicted membrane protein